jgi:hypothetical protein
MQAISRCYLVSTVLFLAPLAPAYLGRAHIPTCTPASFVSLAVDAVKGSDIVICNVDKLKELTNSDGSAGSSRTA